MKNSQRKSLIKKSLEMREIVSSRPDKIENLIKIIKKSVEQL